MIPFPSLVGTNPNNVRIDGDVKAGNSPGSDSSPCQTFPEFLPVAYDDGAPLTVAGPLRLIPNSLLSLSTPVSLQYEFFHSYDITN